MKDLSAEFNAVRLVECRDPAVIASLLEQGADINQPDDHNRTLLILAAIEGDLALAQFLIGKGADLEKRSVGGFTALMLAVMNERTDVVRLLIDAGADLYKSDEDYHGLYSNALHCAEERGFKEIAQMLREVPAVRSSHRTAVKEKTRHEAVVLKQRTLKEKRGPHKRPSAGP